MSQVQDTAAGCKLFTSESTSISSGTLCAGFGGTGASTLAIRRPILSCRQSLPIIIDAEAGIRCGWTVGVERFACGCACLHSQKQKQLQDIDQDTFVQFGNKVTIWNSFRTVH